MKIIYFWKKTLLINALLLLLLTNPLSAQWVLPPYKTVTEKNPFGVSYYWGDADLDGDGELEIINLDERRGCYSRFPAISVYKKGKMLDAFNCSSRDKFISCTEIVSAKNKDYFFFLATSKRKFELKALWVENNELVVKTIYEYGVNVENIYAQIFKTLKIGDDIIIYFSTGYPGKNSLRRIIKVNLNNLQTVWSKVSVDITLKPFYSSEYPDYFYYGTFAYKNFLFRSHKTYYKLFPQKKRFHIDTSFIPNPPPEPDISADDYATDTCAYIVKIDFRTGEEVKRIKVGNAFFHVRPQKKVADAFVNIIVFNRAMGLSSLAKFYFGKDTLIYSKNKAFINVPSVFSVSGHALTFYDNFLIRTDSTNTSIFTLEENGEPKFYKRYNFPFVMVAIERSTPEYFMGFNYDFLFIFDKKFNLLSKIKLEELLHGEKFEGYKIIWSKKLNKLAAVSTEKISFAIKLVKLPWYKRLTPKLVETLLWGTIILLFVLIVMWVATMRISSLKLKEKNAQLEQKNRELEIATAKLIHSEKLALLGTISASFAHQLNSPLGAILNSAERILKKSDDPNASLIKRSAEFSKHLVQKFLETSRADYDKELPCTDFSEAFQSWLELFGNEITKRNIEIVTKFAHKENFVAIKKSELLEIITNILFNARDAILAAQKREKKIFIATETEENRFIIVIEDTGNGFDNKMLENAFEPFQTTKKVGQGTGLGLWIVKKLIDHSNGEIYLQNSSHGAKVIITLNSKEKCE